MSNIETAVQNAMHRIEDLYYQTDGHCYVSFSGGKDSMVLLALIKMCEEIYTIPENAIPAVFANTGIEMGITIDFVNWVKENYYQNLHTIYPEKPFDWVLKTEGKPIKSKQKSKDLRQYHYGKRSESLVSMMTSGRDGQGKMSKKHRFADKDMHMLHDKFDIKPSFKCCDYMKKHPFEKYARDFGMLGTLLGLRQGEGGARDSAVTRRLGAGGELCTWVKDGIIQKAPIIDWSDEDIGEFIENYKIPMSKAYTRYGFPRTGCMGCPFAMNVAHSLYYLYYHEPNRYKACMHWLKDVYIAQNVVLSFDEEYENERQQVWREKYEPMRQEMLRKYRPNSSLIKEDYQINIFDILGG